MCWGSVERVVCMYYKDWWWGGGSGGDFILVKEGGCI